MDNPLIKIVTELTANGTCTQRLYYQDGRQVHLVYWAPEGISKLGEPHQIAFIDPDGTYRDVEPYTGAYKDYDIR